MIGSNPAPGTIMGSGLTCAEQMQIAIEVEQSDWAGYRSRKALTWANILRSQHWDGLTPEEFDWLEEIFAGDWDGRGLPAPTQRKFCQLVQNFEQSALRRPTRFPPYWLPSDSSLALL